jgi:putative PEP-CTERM system TPR-repeat lipoprotein
MTIRATIVAAVGPRQASRLTRRAIRIATLAVFALSVGCAKVDPQAELAAAERSFASGDYGSADVHVNNVVQAEPGNVAGWTLRGRVSLAVGRYGSARAGFERARALGAATDVTAEGYAAALLQTGAAEQALQVLDEPGAAALQGRASYWTLRGQVLLAGGKIEEAAAAFTRSGALGSESVGNIVGRAQLAAVRGQTAEAETLLSRAAALMPDDPEVLGARGALYLQMGKFAEAAAALRAAADGYANGEPLPREAAVLSTLVQTALATNDVDTAAATAQRLAARFPDTAVSGYAESLVEYRRGHLDQALGRLQTVVRDQPDNPRVLTLLGATHMALNNLGQAEQQFLRVLAIAPGDPAAVKLLAETRLRQQRPEAARESLQELDDDPDDPQLGVLRGLAALGSGQAAEAIAYLEHAVALEPANQASKLQLARAYLVAGRSKDSIDLLGKSFGPSGADSELARAFMLLLGYVQNSDVKGGRERAAALAKESPSSASVLTAVAMFYQLLGDVQLARQHLESAVAADGSFAPARLQLADVLIKDGRPADAEEQLKATLAAHPRSAEAAAMLARLLSGRGAFDEAESVLKQALGDSQHIRLRLALARLEFKRGRLPDAERYVTEAEQIAPDDPDVALSRGVLALAQGRPQQAATLLAKVRAAYPTRPDVALSLAQAQTADGQLAAARETLQQALQAIPSYWPLRAALGSIELRLGKAEAALAIATTLQAELPHQQAGYGLEADVRMAQRRYDAAAERLAVAYGEQPSWNLLVRRSLALQLGGHQARVRPLLEDWLRVHPDHGPARLALASALQAEGHADLALEQYEQLLRAKPDDVAALNNAAWLRFQTGKPGAVDLAEKAYRLAPDNAAVLDTYGWILARQNREREAIGPLLRAAQLAPKILEIRYHVAATQVQLGRIDEARVILEDAVSGNEPFESRAVAQALLESL